MIRQPTPDPMAWWRSALADATVPRHDNDPQPGYYARRAVKGGPLIPVKVTLHQAVDPETGELTEPEIVRATELGRDIDPRPIWTHLRPISEVQFDALCRGHETDALMQATHVAVDLTETPMRP